MVLLNIRCSGGGSEAEHAIKTDKKTCASKTPGVVLID